MLMPVHSSTVQGISVSVPLLTQLMKTLWNLLHHFESKSHEQRIVAYDVSARGSIGPSHMRQDCSQTTPRNLKRTQHWVTEVFLWYYLFWQGPHVMYILICPLWFTFTSGNYQFIQFVHQTRTEGHIYA